MAVSSRWVIRYCRISTKGLLLEIPRKFIKDPQILTWLSAAQKVDNFVNAFKLLVTNMDNRIPEIDFKDKVQLRASELYTLLHSRYVLTEEGLKSVREKYIENYYGNCPRVFCESHAMLPVGLDDRPDISTAKCFCPKCRDVYEPTSHIRNIDGSAFGTSLPHVFLQRFPDLCPEKTPRSYTPKIYGFRINENAYELRRYRGEVIDETVL